MSKDYGLLYDAKSLARWLEKINIPLTELRVGDIICDGVSDPYFVCRIEKNDNSISFFDRYDNESNYSKTTINIKEATIRILKRDIIVEKPYD